MEAVISATSSTYRNYHFHLHGEAASPFPEPLVAIQQVMGFSLKVVSVKTDLDGCRNL